MSNLDAILQNIKSPTIDKEESRQKFASDLAKYCNEVQGIANSKSEDDDDEGLEGHRFPTSIVH